MDFHGLFRILGILHTFLMHHDLLDEQSQQFRRQFRDIGVALGRGDEAIGAGNRIPQFLDGRFFRRNLRRQLFLLLRIAAGQRLELLHRNMAKNSILRELLSRVSLLAFPFILKSDLWATLTASQMTSGRVIGLETV